VESVGLPTFLPTFSRELVTDCLAPNNHPPILANGTHSSFLHTILRVRLAGIC